MSCARKACAAGKLALSGSRTWHVQIVAGTLALKPSQLCVAGCTRWRCTVLHRTCWGRRPGLPGPKRRAAAAAAAAPAHGSSTTSTSAPWHLSCVGRKDGGTCESCCTDCTRAHMAIATHTGCRCAPSMTEGVTPQCANHSCALLQRLGKVGVWQTSCARGQERTGVEDAALGVGRQAEQVRRTEPRPPASTPSAYSTAFAHWVHCALMMPHTRAGPDTQHSCMLVQMAQGGDGQERTSRRP